MKQLTTATNTFGPFNSIEVMADRYTCDGIEYQFDVIGAATVDDYIPPTPALPTPPDKVTRRQALQALLINGVTEAQIITAINALPVSDLDKGLALIEFNESFEFEYNRPLVIQMCAVLGLDRDDLFRLAGTR